jgi:fatty acid desaturase
VLRSGPPWRPPSDWTLLRFLARRMSPAGRLDGTARAVSAAAATLVAGALVALSLWSAQSSWVPVAVAVAAVVAAVASHVELTAISRGRRTAAGHASR